ncbi:MAG: iron-sulfur cluster assembly scaffold protein [Pseudomonadota bacterium]
MADSDLIKLYSDRILELASSIPHATRLEAPHVTVTRRSPQCGSTITVDLCATDGVITAFGQDVKACALGQASAALVGASILGRSLADMETGRDALAAMLSEDATPPEPPFEGFDVLTPARAFKNRHASILLVFDATVEAMTTLAAKSASA